MQDQYENHKKNTNQADSLQPGTTQLEFNRVETPDEAVAWIHALEAFGIKPGLKRMEALLERLGNPEHELKFLHVAGTNGKGSTINYLAEILMAAGYQVGVFTSPYLIEFSDRIKINRNNIPGADLVDCVNELIPHVQAMAAETPPNGLGSPTEFEVVTALAILYYSRQAALDLVLWETGLGGRLDSTNVVTPLLSLITNIGYDHLNILGSTIEEIAAEKAGIIKSGIPVITGTENPAARAVIEDRATELGAPLYLLGRDFIVEPTSVGAFGSTFNFRLINHTAANTTNNNLDANTTPGHTDDSATNNSDNPDNSTNLANLGVRMLGAHQLTNAGLAVMAALELDANQGFQINEQAIQLGLLSAYWLGRFEEISSDPLVIIDGAHNPDGARTVAAALELVDYNKLILVLGALHDKPLADFLGIMIPLADEIITTEPQVPRRAAATDLKHTISTIDPAMPVTALADYQEALSEGLGRLGPGDLLLVTGSLYLIADARKYLIKILESEC